MCKNGIEEVHTTLVGSQGAHRIGEVKKTNKKKKERMKNGREEEGKEEQREQQVMTIREGGLKKEGHMKKKGVG